MRKFFLVWVSREVWMDVEVRRHRSKLPGHSRKPDLLKRVKSRPRPPPRNPKVPDRQPHGPGGFTSPTVLAKGLY